jgi:hypothetical protein
MIVCSFHDGFGEQAPPVKVAIRGKARLTSERGGHKMEPHDGSIRVHAACEKAQRAATARRRHGQKRLRRTNRSCVYRHTISVLSSLRNSWDTREEVAKKVSDESSHKAKCHPQ